MTRILTGILVVMAAVFMTNCGGSAAPAAQSGKVVIWAWDQNLASINYAAKKYKEAHPDSKVDIVVQNVPDTVSKMSTFLASGTGTDLPDMVLMANEDIQIFLQQFPDKFVNLSKLGYDKYKDDFSKAHWEILSHEGSIYAFPFDIAPLMIAVNTDITKAAGVDPVSFKTWDDVIAAVKKIKAAGFGVHKQFGRSEVLGMMQSAGVGIFDAQGQIDLLNPTVVEVIDKYIQLEKAKVSDSSLGDESYGEGKTAMSTKPAWAIGEDMPNQVKLDGKVTLIPLPKVKDAPGFTSSANDGGSSFFILESSTVKDIAYALGEIITTDMGSQEVALTQGLMPGFGPAVTLPSLNAPVPYYQGQPIWKLLGESAKDTPPVYVPKDFQTGKDVFTNKVVDIIRAGTSKSAKDILTEAADFLAKQTGRTIHTY